MVAGRATGEPGAGEGEGYGEAAGGDGDNSAGVVREARHAEEAHPVR